MREIRNPVIANALSGAIGGVSATILTFPLDVITVRMQVQRSDGADNGEQYKSVYDAFYKIVCDEGIGELFDGVGSDSIATLLQAFLYFYAYDFLRNKRLRYKLRKTGRVPRSLGVREELFYGSVAGIFCKLFTAPLNNITVLKQTMHRAAAMGAAEEAHKGTLDCIKEIYAHKGPTGFWSGFKASILLSANPSLAYYFYQRLNKRGREGAAGVFLRAAIAKSMATLITYPFILAKTRTQASREHDRTALLAKLVATAKTDGFSGLYDGAQAQLVKGFFSQGITMTTKESIANTVGYFYLYFVRSYLT